MNTPPLTCLRNLLCCVLPVVVFVSTLAAVPRSPGIPANYELAYEQSFEQPQAARDFVVSDPALWRVSREGTNTALELFSPLATTTNATAKPGPRNTQTAYKPVHRSPLGIALVADRVFGDFILDVDMQSTVEPYGHQDLCLFYGFQSPTEFYYTHLAVAADSNAHNIFIVNQAPRRNLAQQTTAGIPWGQRVWHTIRIERTVSDGAIRVYFDDLTRPIMRAVDRTFTSGRVGVGSFDDLGRFDNLRVWAASVQTRKAEFFERLRLPE